MTNEPSGRAACFRTSESRVEVLNKPELRKFSILGCEALKKLSDIETESVVFAVCDQ